MGIFNRRKMVNNRMPSPSRNNNFPVKREKPKSCERKVKRDGQGRIIQEKFIGCSREEIKAMREIESEEESK